MKKELIINNTASSVDVALLEEGKLVELHKQKSNNKFTVGDIFLGRVKKTKSGLNAAFVDIGHKRDAFLHYTDLGPQFSSLKKFTRSAISGGISSSTLEKFILEKDINKGGKIDEVVKRNEFILVQVLKEPISTKGPRLSCEITIPGRYLVLTPFNNSISISKKISSPEEKTRLKRLVGSIKPQNFGVIVRTASEGIKVAHLHEELRSMMEKWNNIFTQLHNNVPPLKLMSELDKTSSIIRDVLSDSFSKIIVNDKDLFASIKSYLSEIAPQQEKIVDYYSGTAPLFDSYGITKQIKSSFGKTSTMSSGAYLVIEHTEAMHVIDVNSGYKSHSSNMGEAILKVNLESAEEIARQLRLRDMGGLVIIDFIDMKTADHRKQLLEAMRDFMKIDRAQHSILPLSKFGLMQITRQRVRPELKIKTTEKCPVCNGSGEINASILVIEDIERDINYIKQSGIKGDLTIVAHPFVEAYMNKGWWRTRTKQWQKQFKMKLKVTSNNDYHIMEYKLFDSNNDEVRLN